MYMLLAYIVIPHLEIRAYDWSKSCHMMGTKSHECPHETLVPSCQFWFF